MDSEKGVLKSKNGFLNLKFSFLNFSGAGQKGDYYQIFNNMMTTGFCGQILKSLFNKIEILPKIREIFPDFCLTSLKFSLTLAGRQVVGC